MNDFKLSSSNLGDLVTLLTPLLNEEKEWRVSIKQWRELRTLSQNGLFHRWCGELSAYLIGKRRKDATPEFSKILLKHTFLGYETLERVNCLTGEKIIVRELRHTSKLDKGDMTYFMSQCQSWAIDIGLFFTVPADSEYMKLLERQIR